MRELPLKVQKEMRAHFEKHNTPEHKRKELAEKAKSLYRKMVYDPQEPVGVVAAQSLSEPCTQMSIDYNEKVIIKHNGAIAVVKIGEFIDKALEASGRRCPDGWDARELSSQNILVPGITQDERIAWMPISACSRHEAPESLLEIRTLSGRKITATDSHSFVTRLDNKVVSIAGSALKPGDRIPSMKFLPENCAQKLDVKSVVGEDAMKWAKKTMPETLALDNGLGWFFGAYLAEGNCTKNYVSLSNVDEAFLSSVREFARHRGFTFNEYDNFRGFARGHDIRLNSSLLSKLMRSSCGTGAGNKVVPAFAYSAAEPFVSGMLRGYFDGDGNVSVSRRVIRVSSNSSELISGMAVLLSRFGIFANKRAGKQFSLSIPYKYAKTFREKIGFTVGYKAQSLDELCRLYERFGSRDKDMVDMIGGFGSILAETSRKLGLATRYVNSSTKRQRIGRESLLRHISRFGRASSENGIDISGALETLKKMAGSDVVWDEITEISRVKPSGKYVYDFTVKGTETFTTFEGIVTHNTMRTYHFAGTAGIQVTLGLPRMMEIFDARKEPRTPMMVVKLKPGLDAEQVKQIAENIKEIKFRDVVESTLLDMTEMWVKFKMDADKARLIGIDIDKLPKNIRMKNTEPSVEGGHTLMVRAKKGSVSNLRKLKYVILDTHVKGIKGISQVVVTKENDEWTISTLGSNLRKVFEIEGVDPARTTTNNIFEIYDALGIEAARNALIQQAKYTMDEQGLGVDIRYIMLLADVMTANGDVRAIGRYGVAGQKASVLVRASFEETKKHITAAAIKGESDPLLGAIENIILNQVAPVGTGSFDLVGRLPGPKGKYLEEEAGESEG